MKVKQPASLDLEELYQDNAQMLFQFVLAKCGNEDLAEEIVQETFVQAIDASTRFQGNAQVSTWLCSIANNQLKTWYRKHPYTKPVEEQLADQMKDHSDVEYLKLLHELEEPYREVMYLRLFGSLSYKQIGEIFSKSENWARITFFRGREKLKKVQDHDNF